MAIIAVSADARALPENHPSEGPRGPSFLSQARTARERPALKAGRGRGARRASCKAASLTPPPLHLSRKRGDPLSRVAPRSRYIRCASSTARCYLNRNSASFF
jgi:hypothetical protein